MKDPTDTRDIGPRTGSPLWVYLTVVSAAGLAALCTALAGLSVHAVHLLFGKPLLWTIAVLILAGELRPIMTPGKTDQDSGVPSVTFGFAALLYWGLPVAAVLKTAATLVAGTADRKAVFRNVFNAAQDVLALGAAWLMLGLVGLQRSPQHHYVPAGDQLPGIALAAAAYFAVNFALVTIAVSLHERAPLLRMTRRDLPYQAFVNLALLSIAPLVVLVMDRSVLFVLLFLLPLAAVYLNASVSVQREHQAMHDELTGLPNRSLLQRRAGEVLAGAARTGQVAGFLLLDLDRFKEVNDTLGHPAGDQLLQAVAHRLTHSVRPGDMVARLGGDEFAVLLPVIKSPSTAREVAARLRAALAEPLRLEGMTLHVGASVGIATYPADAADVEQLLQRADVAMYLAKDSRSGVEEYDQARDRNSAGRLTLLADLRRAVEHGDVELAFAPKVWLADGRPAGMEAMLRWRHPDRGMIAVSECAEAAGHSDVMHELTRHAVDSALDQACQWWQAGLTVQVSLAVSARDLLDAGLAAAVSCGLDRRGLPREALMLQVSERLLTGQPDRAGAAVDVLAGLGLPVSLDEFGTGYTSLTRLRRLPVREIKFDSSFVGCLPPAAGDEVIVRSLVGMVRALGIRSVAKGVESPAAASALRELGCDVAQGTYIGWPLAPAAATAWLRARGPAPALPGDAAGQRATVSG